VKRIKAPRYKFFRMYIFTITLFSVLFFTNATMNVVKNSPELLNSENIELEFVSDKIQDITKLTPDADRDIHEAIDISIKNKEKFKKSELGKIEKETTHYFYKTMMYSVLIGFLLNVPIKFYFFRKRNREGEFPEKHFNFIKRDTFNNFEKYAKIYTQKFITYTPFINSGVLLGGFLFFLIYVNYGMVSTVDGKKILLDVYTNILRKSFLFSIPSVTLIFLWQKYNVDNFYLEYIFKKEELRKIREKRFGGKIISLMLMTSFVTAIFPMIIVIMNILDSISYIDIDKVKSVDQLNLIFGKYMNFFRGKSGNDTINWLMDKAPSEFTKMIYVNPIDTVQMIIVITISVFITLIYVIMMVKFTSKLINKPIFDLMENMKKFAEGDYESYSIVRSNNELGKISEGFNNMIDEVKERERVKKLFGQYLTTEISEEILKGNVKLGGDIFETTILFSDIRNFTSISEKISAEEVVIFLNSYLNYMIDAVVKYNGIVDKFLGDGILAVFGAPIKSEDHYERALLSAVAMHEALVSLNNDRIKKGEFEIEIGIGLHSGSVIAGNLGNDKKLEYTVIGDTVNLASRIEDLTKIYKSKILISETTYKNLSEKIKKIITIKKIEGIDIKGKSEKINVYEVSDYEMLKTYDFYEYGLKD